MLGVLAERKGMFMSVSLRGSIERLAEPGNLDSSVDEIFEMMLGAKVCRSDCPKIVMEPGSVTAVVGFGGLLSGPAFCAPATAPPANWPG